MERNRSARYGCQRARGLRPSCHPRCARRRSWFAATRALLTRGVLRGLRRVTRGVLRGMRRVARGWRAWDAANCARMACVGCGELRAAGVRGLRRIARRARAADAHCEPADARHAPHSHPRPRRRPGGPGGTRGEALVLSDAETGSFGGAWNARRNGARRRQRAKNAPSSARNKRAVIKAQPIGAVRLSESTRASPLVPPALRAASSVGWDVLCAADVRRQAWDGMGCVACG